MLDTARNVAAPAQAVAPTAKYTSYRSEVETQLAGKLSKRERQRLEFELKLLDRARFIEINGVVHQYQDIGPRDGEPLVLVHGWDCSSFWWHNIVDPLALAGYRVISYDLKGHGFSDSDPRRDYTVSGFTNDLLAITQALNLEPHHVAAFSLGAFVALRYAADYSDRVRSLTLFNFSLMTPGPFISKLVPHLLDFVFNTALRPIERRNLWWIPFVYARAVLAKNTPPVNDIRLGTLSLRCCDPEAIRVSAHELAQPEVLDAVGEQMRRVQQPTLLVAGSGDPIFRPSDGRKLMQLAPRGTFIEVPKCGHLILFELPEQVIQILRLFLHGVRA